MNEPEQRKETIKIANDYLWKTSRKNVCSFLNSGKLDINTKD